jgi:flagellar secretion chaperone FliS
MIVAGSTALAYRRAEVGTADRRRLLMMMFDGALAFLGRAERDLADGALDGFAHHLGRAQAIIAELLHTLDHEAGGDIAGELARLYDFMLDHLVEANVRKSPSHVAAVRRVLGVIAGAFREIADAPLTADAV